MRPEAVILDLGRPGIDGYEVARRMRADPLLRGVLLVALSGYGQASDRERSAAAGVDVRLVKPVAFDALHRAVARRRDSP